MANKLTYTITYDSVDYDTRPINGWKKTSAKDDGNIEQGFYVDKISKLKFGRDDFSLMQTIEADSDCNLATIVITKVCSGSTSTIFSGKFTKKDISLNLSKCTAEVSVENNDIYTCIFANWKGDTDILMGLGNAQTRSVFLSNFQAVVNTTGTNPGQDYVQVDTIVIASVTYYVFVRQIHIVDCNGSSLPNVPANYTILSNDCLTYGTATYTQPVLVNNFTATETQGDDTFQVSSNPVIYVSSIQQSSQLSASFDNGRTLEDVILHVAQGACSTITDVVSDFFQMNPLVSSSTNYVTGEDNVYTDLVVYQMTDIIYWNASENATRAKMNFQQLMKDLHALFFIKWWIDGTELRIEHYSYSQSSGSTDLSNTTGRLYTREKTKLYGRHTYETPFQRNLIFVSSDITYTSQCVEDSKQENKTQYFSCDIPLMLAYPDDAPKETFVLVNTDGTEILRGGSTVFTEQAVNGDMGWRTLIPNFHLYEKSDANSDWTFVTLVKTKKKVIRVDDCCDTFDNFQDITTEFGTAEVKSTSWTPKTGRKEITVLI